MRSRIASTWSELPHCCRVHDHGTITALSRHLNRQLSRHLCSRATNTSKSLQRDYKEFTKTREEIYRPALTSTWLNVQNKATIIRTSLGLTRGLRIESSAVNSSYAHADWIGLPMGRAESLDPLATGIVIERRDLRQRFQIFPTWKQ